MSAVVAAGCGEAAAPFGALGRQHPQGQGEGDFLGPGGAVEVQPGVGVLGRHGGPVGARVGETGVEAVIVGAQGLDGAPQRSVGVRAEEIVGVFAGGQVDRGR
ncbi:hypothetical protein ACRJ4W_35605 [Streptomyces sp. GLT-R25]